MEPIWVSCIGHWARHSPSAVRTIICSLCDDSAVTFNSVCITCRLVWLLIAWLCYTKALLVSLKLIDSLKSRNLKRICLLLSWNEMAYRSHWEFFKKNIKLLSRRRRYILNSKPSDGLKNFGQWFHLGGITCTHHGTLSDINFIENFQNFILHSCSMFISRLTFGIACLKRKKKARAQKMIIEVN